MLREPLVWIEVDLGAVAKNVQTLKALIAPTVRFCAVVKSNAYGHGLVPIAEAAVAAGADWLAVIDPNEARELREAAITVPILITGVVAKSAWPWCAAHGVRITVGDKDQLQSVVRYRGPALTIHLKVETGLGRLGFLPAEIPEVVRTLQTNPAVMLEGISSHFASVEEQDLDYTERQVAEFRRVTDQLDQPLIRHMAATAALMQLPDSHFDMVRAGIGIYGLWPSDGVKQAMQQAKPSLVLVPALSFRARIVQVKTVPAGTTVGYGRTHSLTRDTLIAVIAAGYADGYDRGLSNKASVLIHGQRCPVIGRVAMNMIMVDCSAVSQTKAGDIVTLIGRDKSEEITADEVASWADTINYEIVTRIPVHIDRKYFNQ